MAPAPVLDSDILIDFLRGSGPGRDLIRELAKEDGYRVTAISAFELALGRSYAENPAPVRALLAAPALTLTRAAGLISGALLAELRARGQAIGIRDAMQAGICLESNAPLVTKNLARFERITDLIVVHPTEWKTR